MDEPIREYYDDLPDTHVETMRALREVILDVAPDAGETITWNNPVYVVDGTNRLGLVPHSDYINLQFFAGAHLADPDGLIEGTGKSMRHVTISSREDVNRPELRSLIERALNRARNE